MFPGLVMFVIPQPNPAGRNEQEEQEETKPAAGFAAAGGGVFARRHGHNLTACRHGPRSNSRFRAHYSLIKIWLKAVAI